jgi:hypothetical protein
VGLSVCLCGKLQVCEIWKGKRIEFVAWGRGVVWDDGVCLVKPYNC